MRLNCSLCGRGYERDGHPWRCDCGGRLEIDWPSRFPKDRIAARPAGLWRYREALPLEQPEECVTLGEPMTALAPFEGLLLKCEHLLPSGSYKDRGAAVMLSAIREMGVGQILEDSSGNAGAAIAAYSARAGVRADIYCPAAASPAKLRQIAAYGATLRKIDGPRVNAAAAALAAARTSYYASHCWNPFFLHGVKTIAFEIAEQLGWAAPDRVVLPVGNGALLLGLWRGFRELTNAGTIADLPKLIAVQAAACAPLARNWRGEDVIEPASTVAEGIAIAAPVRKEEILAAVRESGGEITEVDEAEIVSGLRHLVRNGFYLEPTAAVAYAAARRLQKTAGATVVPLTGHGLKAAEQVAFLLDGIGSDI